MPDQPSQDLSTYKVYSGGNEMPSTINLISIVVDKSIGRVPFARLILKDGDPASQNFENSNNTGWQPGSTIKIEAGFHNHNLVIFEGIIIKQQVRLKNSIESFLVIDCKDKVYTMTLAAKNKYFIDTKDSDAVDSIAGTYGLQTDIDSTSLTHKQLVQYNCSDWDFTVARMELNGLYVFASQGRLICKKPTVGDAAVTAIYGTDVMSFDAAIDATNQYDTVSCKAWSSSDQDVASSDNDPVSLTEAGDLSSSSLAGKVNQSKIVYNHSGRRTVDELKSWATAQQTKNILSKTRGVLTCIGKLEAVPAATLQLTGFGNHYSGKHFISGVRNELKNNVWETTIQFGWWPELFTKQFDVNQPPASGLLPAVRGLQIGLVTKLENDPESEFRIQVKLPLADNAAEGFWARVALLDAGNGRGSFFMPYVGDEVIIGFINDDPRDAVVLGMLNSGSNPAPFTPADDNYEKGFVSKNNLRITFNEDKKVILLQTPAGKSITLDDNDQNKIVVKDENNNSIEMSSGGIIIKSAKDLQLKATGDIKLEGVNVETTASGNFKAQGSGGVSIQSSGTAELKGSVVNIN